jgi:hypothetical protein
MLKRLVELHGENWRFISEFIPGRHPKACQNRWIFCLDPRLDHSPFTAEEDEALVKLIREHGTNWTAIIEHFPTRSRSMICGRYHNALRHSYPDLEIVVRQAKTEDKSEANTAQQTDLSPVKMGYVVTDGDSSATESNGEDGEATRSTSTPNLTRRSRNSSNVPRSSGALPLLSTTLSKRAKVMTPAPLPSFLLPALPAPVQPKQDTKPLVDTTAAFPSLFVLAAPSETPEISQQLRQGKIGETGKLSSQEFWPSGVHIP